MTEYTMIHPTGDVSLARLTRAALAIAGNGRVFVTTNLGRQVLRVPADKAGRIYEEVGLTADGQVPAPQRRTAKPASEPEKESQPTPGSDAPKTTASTSGRPAGRAGGRAAGKRAAKKTTAPRTPARSNEGDDQ